MNPLWEGFDSVANDNVTSYLDLTMNVISLRHVKGISLMILELVLLVWISSSLKNCFKFRLENDKLGFFRMTAYDLL